MGQWPAILAAPSFRDQLHSVPQGDFVPSADFSRGIDSQWAWLHKQQPFRYSSGLVTSISARGGSHQGFDVTWEEHDGSTHQVHAANVDVCGGPGPSRRLCETRVDASLWPYPRSPRLETGESYLGKAATLAGAGERIAVIGGGPTAAWCVERALANHNRVLWVSDKDVNPAFVSSRRNDGLAAGKLDRVRQDRTTTVTYNVVPGSPDLLFAEFFDVDFVHDAGSSVLFDLSPRVTGRIVEHSGQQHRGLGIMLDFAQVILALGQETGFEAPCNTPGCTLKRETNSWATRLIGLIPPDPKQHLIVKDKMEVGLQSGDGTLRVLGASFLAHPYADSVFNDSSSELFGYVGSLTEQAQVNRGASVAAMTTALANDYFDYQPNLNRNGATLGQLKAIQFVAPYANLVHDIRTRRIHPVTNGEADAVDQFTRDRCT